MVGTSGYGECPFRYTVAFIKSLKNVLSFHIHPLKCSSCSDYNQLLMNVPIDSGKRMVVSVCVCVHAPMHESCTSLSQRMSVDSLLESAFHPLKTDCSGHLWVVRQLAAM